MFDERRIMRGTFGQVILDGEDLTNIKSFQARVEFEKEDVKKARSLATYTRIIGYKGTGSISTHKVDSRMTRLLTDKIKRGETPTFTILARLDDPDAWGAESVLLEGVVFDDLTLFDYEVGASGMTDAPFTFSNWTPYDMV